MKNYILLCISLAAALGGNIARKYCTDRNRAGLSGYFAYTAVSGCVAAAVLLLWGGFGSASAFTVRLAVAFGAVTAAQSIAHMIALQTGPMSYTTVIISFSTLISALSGVFFFSETLGWAQVVGMLFMAISFLLATVRRKGEKGMSFRWLVFCLLAFAATGAIGIMQKAHQSSAHRGELSAFLILSFSVSVLLSAITALFLRAKGRREAGGTAAPARRAGIRQTFAFMAVVLVSGICVAVNNKCNLYLSGVMDSAVFFPLVNGGGLVLTTLAAVLIFREKLTKKQWFGIACGILSVVFLCDPFG